MTKHVHAKKIFRILKIYKFQYIDILSSFFSLMWDVSFSIGRHYSVCYSSLLLKELSQAIYGYIKYIGNVVSNNFYGDVWCITIYNSASSTLFLSMVSYLSSSKGTSWLLHSMKWGKIHQFYSFHTTLYSLKSPQTLAFVTSISVALINWDLLPGTFCWSSLTNLYMASTLCY